MCQEKDENIWEVQGQGPPNTSSKTGQSDFRKGIKNKEKPNGILKRNWQVTLSKTPNHFMHMLEVNPSPSHKLDH